MMANSDIQGIYMGFLGRIDTLTGSRILGQLITVEEGGVSTCSLILHVSIRGNQTLTCVAGSSMCAVDHDLHGVLCM